MNRYYVYVYIDPRNYEEFYFGKGIGSRKHAHLDDTVDSDKVRRIKAIQDAGLRPIIRVIARNLSEHDAFLVEKTLLWKLGKHLTNKASGHYAENFRPHDTLHLELCGFDFENGIYYYNVGEGPHRNWDDFRKFNFISAGHGSRWRDAVRGFVIGDLIAAYLKGKGFVGIGRITSPAKPIREVSISGVPLLSLPLQCKNMGEYVDSEELSENVCLVEWIQSVDRAEAKWRRKPKLFTSTHVRASLDAQQETIDFLEREFSTSIRELLK